MSLATTCPSCGTCFRVVQDQLRVSEGWVRCGNCQNVFNALESLFDLDAPREVLESPETQFDEPSRGVWQTEASARWMRRRDASSWPEPEVSHALHTGGNDEDAPEREEPLSDSVRAALHAEPLSTETVNNDEALHDSPQEEAPDTGPTLASALIEGTFEGDLAPAGGASFDETIYVPHEFSGETSGEPSTPAPAAPGPAPQETPAQDLLHSAAPALHALDSAPSPGRAEDAAANPHEPNWLAETGVEADLFSGHTPALAAEEPVAEASNNTPPEAAEANAETPALESLTASSLDKTTADDSHAHEAAAELPDFVRHADRLARWHKPGPRIALACSALLFMAALAGQVAWHWRDLLAASWPPAQAPLQAVCTEFGCELAAPRRLEALVVDNTTLTRPPGVSGYRLAVHLRNRADHAVAAPSFDLVLTDAQGAVLSRRVIPPQDFDFREPALEALAETVWTLEFALNDGSLVGYTLAAFYP